MTGGTHIMLGAAGGIAVAAATDHPGWPHEMLILTAVVASMLPDLDEENSMIHRYTMGHIHPKMRRLLVGLAGMGLLFLADQSVGFFLAGLFLLLTSLLRHRTFTHSLLALAMIAEITYQIDPDLAPAAAAGYVSHLLADSMTPHGVPWLWPWSKCFRVAHIPTGSIPDHIIGLTAFFMSFAAWLSL